MFGLQGYELFQVPPDELEAFLGGGNLAGLNVTNPYKKTVARFCHTLSESARQSGSVNTLLFDGKGRIHGHNTDYAGFLSMANRAGVSFSGRKVVLLGNGGAAATASLAARKRGAREVVNISRRGEHNFGNLERHADADVLVNCTPVGTYPQNDEAIVDIDKFHSLKGVLDLVYNPLRTKLAVDAEERGIPSEGGLYMLAEQAREASAYFQNKSIPEAETKRVFSQLCREIENVVLVGMPGCGKNAVGREVARLLKRRLVDTDELIELQTGRSPAEWITQDGERAFRDVETRVTRQATRESGIVLTTGGGGILRPENRLAMRQTGRVYWLLRPLNELATKGRPLSVNLDELFEKRRGAYEAASNCKININGNPEKAARLIVEEFHKHAAA